MGIIATKPTPAMLEITKFLWTLGTCNEDICFTPKMDMRHSNWHTTQVCKMWYQTCCLKLMTGKHFVSVRKIDENYTQSRGMSVIYEVFDWHI